MADNGFMKGLLILLYFTMLQLIIYADRSVIGGILSILQSRFDITGFQSGLLGTGCIGGFVLMSPIVAILGRGKWMMPVIGLGLLLFVASVFACSFAESYPMLLLARIGVGCGEASFCSLAPPIINDTAPPKRTSVYLGIYFAAIFVGLGFGFVFSGSLLTWPDAQRFFFAEGLCMLPLCACSLIGGSCFASSEAKGDEQSKSLLPEERRVAAQYRSSSRFYLNSLRASKANPDKRCIYADIFQNKAYGLLVLGYAAQIFTVGGLAFWFPSYLEKYVQMDKASAQGYLGIVTGLSGITGTAFGGILLDGMSSTASSSSSRSRAYSATRICVFFSAAAAPLSILAVAAQTKEMFFVLLFLGQFAIFATTAPVNISMMEIVEKDHRGLAMGMCTLASHVLGDLVSPAIVGEIVDATGNLKLGVWILAGWLVWTVICWALALRVIPTVPSPT